MNTKADKYMNRRNATMTKTKESCPPLYRVANANVQKKKSLKKHIAGIGQ